MIKGAIFDFDGTLFDTMPFWATLGSSMIKKAGLTPIKGLDEAVLFMTLEESCAFIKDAYNLKESVTELVDNVVKEVANFYCNHASPKAGIVEFMAEFKRRGIPCVIATASDRRLIEIALKRHNLLDKFEAIFTCSELNLNKRNGDIYNRCADFLSLKPEEIAVFEDILVATKSAKLAGFFTVAVEDVESEREREEIKQVADLYISSDDSFDIFWSAKR